MSGRKLTAVWLMLSFGNVLYQAFGSQQFHVAVERSYFQGSAILCVWLLTRSDYWLK